MAQVVTQTPPTKLTRPRPEVDVARVLGIDRRGRTRRWMRRVLWLVVLAAALLGAGRLLKHWREPAPVAYQTAPVARGDLVVTVIATGALEPVNTVEVGPEISGRVAHVRVDFNDRVTAGQVLAELETDLLEGQVAQSRAELAIARAARSEAEATLVEARTNRDRVANLIERGLATGQERDGAEATVLRAEAAVDTAEARVRAVRAALQMAEANLGRATIRSPIDGVVLARLVEEGQTVVAQLQAIVLFRIAEDLTRMELHAQVDEADVGQVRVGQEATFTVASFPERIFPAHVASIRNAPQTSASVVTYETLLEVDNGDLLLRPGMTATVDIVTERRPDRLLVPNAALRFEPPSDGRPEPSREVPGATQETAAGASRVWVLRDGRPHPVDVVPGPTNGIDTVVEDGALEVGAPLCIDVLRPED